MSSTEFPLNDWKSDSWGYFQTTHFNRLNFVAVKCCCLIKNHSLQFWGFSSGDTPPKIPSKKVKITRIIVEKKCSYKHKLLVTWTNIIFVQTFFFCVVVCRSLHVYYVRTTFTTTTNTRHVNTWIWCQQVFSMYISALVLRFVLIIYHVYMGAKK